MLALLPRLLYFSALLFIIRLLASLSWVDDEAPTVGGTAGAEGG
jgi:hypothetical protein